MSVYSATILADTPLAYYRLDEAQPTAADSSGNGHAGTYVQNGSGTTNQQPSLINSDPADDSCLFNSGGYVDLTGLPSVGDVFSFECWVQNDPGTGVCGLISMGTAGGYMRVNNHQLELLRSQTAGIVVGTTTIATWTTPHHFVATKNGASVHLYVDGVDVTGSVSNATCTGGVNPPLLAADSGGENLGNANPTLLDEAAVYAYALTSTQVSAHYAAGIAAPGTSGTANGIATASAVGRAIIPSAGSAAGVATASAVSTAGQSAGTADGLATALGVSAAVKMSAGTANGNSVARAIGFVPAIYRLGALDRLAAAVAGALGHPVP